MDVQESCGSDTRTDLADFPAPRPFHSMAALGRLYDSVGTGITSTGQDYWVVVRKNGADAALGFPGTRYDGVAGMYIMATAEFNLPGLPVPSISSSQNLVEVTYIYVVPTLRETGIDECFYKTLREAGYRVCTKNLQKNNRDGIRWM